MMRNYSALAPLYDRIMSHVEYDHWVLYIQKIIADFSCTTTPALFEIGGGTGVLGQKLVRKGINYQGSDHSEAMCAQARARGLHFFVADARCLPLKNIVSFDMVIFLYDGINYLQSIGEYPVTFAQVYSCLRPRGLFLFDITTQMNSQTNFNEFLDAGDFEEHFYFRRSHYHEATSMQYNDFTIFSKCKDFPDTFKKFNERHEQKVLPITQIKNAVPAPCFDIIGIWDNFSFKHYSPRSERVHFLLQKKPR